MGRPWKCEECGLRLEHRDELIEHMDFHKPRPTVDPDPCNCAHLPHRPECIVNSPDGSEGK